MRCCNRCNNSEHKNYNVIYCNFKKRYIVGTEYPVISNGHHRRVKFKDGGTFAYACSAFEPNKYELEELDLRRIYENILKEINIGD
jgi:hypothetical protein